MTRCSVTHLVYCSLLVELVPVDSFYILGKGKTRSFVYILTVAKNITSVDI